MTEVSPPYDQFDNSKYWPWKTRMLEPGEEIHSYETLSAFLPPHMRHFGLHMVAGIGSGKSYFLGSMLLVEDFERKVPTVVFDTGDTIQNFLRSVTAGKTDYISELNRVVWVDMSAGPGAIVPFPLYYKATEYESTFDISQRFPEILRRIDPELNQAPVQGYNPLWQIATQAGRILVTLGFQITEMQNLLSHTDQWEGRFKQALEIDPSLQDAVDFFILQYPKWSEMLKTSIYRKLTLFTASPSLRAMFGASKPGIDWQRVVDEKQIVLFDFGRIRSLELRRFLMLWVFSSLYEFIRFHSGKRTTPISVVIDELSEMVNLGMDKGQGLENDLNSWINFLMRKYMVWLTVAHQEMYQFSEGISELLLSMGTQMIGKVSNMDDSLHLAKSFFEIDPLKVKRTRFVNRPDIVIGEDGIPQQRTETGITGWGRGMHLGQVGQEHIEEDPIEYTLPEQHYENAYRMTNLNPYWFYVRRAGENKMSLFTTRYWYDRHPTSKEIFDYALPKILGVAVARDYQEIDRILSDVDQRLKQPTPESKPKPEPQEIEQKPAPKKKITGKRLND